MEAFGSSKGTRDCYIQFGALPGLEASEGFMVTFLKTDEGTTIFLQKEEDGAIMNVKGKKAEIKDVYPCAVFGAGGVAESFLARYRNKKSVFPCISFFAPFNSALTTAIFLSINSRVIADYVCFIGRFM